MSPKQALARCAALLLLTPVPAFAHVSLEKPEATRGKSYKAVLKIPHGCEGSPTHTVRVEIPEGFIVAKPMPKAGWTIKTTRGPYAQSYGYYHGPLSEGVKQIEWSGGELPDDFYDEFVAAGFIAEELEDKALYFKVVQVCAKGELSWSELPAAGQSPHDLKAPAAVLKIAGGEKADEHAHHNHGGEKVDAGTGGNVTVGALSVEGAWSRATPEGSKVGVGYLKITNTGSAADTLIGVETPVAGRGEIHDMTMTDGVMRMRKLADGLEIPAGGTVELKPGGMHLMLLDLKQPLVAGARVPVKLTFKSGAVGEVELSVQALGASSGDHDHKH